VVWLKIRIHDIEIAEQKAPKAVVVWLKIRIHDIISISTVLAS